MNIPGVKAWVVHLRSRAYPLDLIADCAHAGLDTSVVDAVDGSNPEAMQKAHNSTPVDLAKSRAVLGFVPSGPMIACAMSHQVAYARFLESGLPVGIFLEEDTRLDCALQQLERVLQWVETKDRPTVVLLFSRGPRLSELSACEELRNNLVVFPFRYPPAQTAAYALNREAALCLRGPVVGAADWPLAASAVDFWGLSPWLAAEDEHGSSIPLPTSGGRRRLLATLTLAQFVAWHKAEIGLGQFLYRAWLPALESLVAARMQGISVLGHEPFGWKAMTGLKGISARLRRLAIAGHRAQ